MKQKFLLKTMLLLFALVVGSGAWAEDEVYYTLTPAAGSDNGYAYAEDITIGGIIWNVTGNATMTPWRIGGKNLTGVDRKVYSKTAMGDAITKVKLTVGTASSVTVNSLKLIVYSDADHVSKIDEVSETFVASSTITFTPSSPATNWPTGAYYEFVFNLTIGSSNKYVQFTGAEFYKAAAAPSACATPTFSPAAGAKPYGTEIAISCATDGASIYYTTNGDTPDPDDAEQLYDPDDKPTVTGTMTIKAIAIDGSGTLSNSAEASADYSVAAPTTPTFSPASGTAVYYGTKVAVASDAGTSIYYTTAASTPDDPTSSSTSYPDGGITINSNQTIKAIAYDAGGNASSVATASYTLKNPEKPTFSVAEGGVAEGTEVELSAATGTTIYYTTDGTEPTSGSSVYSSAITINTSQTIKAIAVDGADNSSEVASASYIVSGIDLRGMYSGNITFSPGSFESSGSGYKSYANVTYRGSNGFDYNGWTLTDVMKSSSNMQMKASSGKVSLPPIKSDAGFTISVTVVTNSVSISDGTNSHATSLVVNSATANNVTITAGGSYAVISTITITPTDGRASAGLAYEIDAYSPYLGSSFSTPTLTNPNSLTVSYSSSDEDVATVNSSTGAVTLKAIGSTTITASYAGDASYKPGEASYTLTVLDPDITEAPTFSVAEGAVPYGTTVTLTTLTDGATIYYTTNGDTPTSGSSVYSSPIAIIDVTTVKAIAIKGGKSSSVSSADYTIANPVAPTFSVTAGKVIAGTEVTLTAPTSCVISYTTDGSDPEDLENVTDGNSVTLTINATQTIKAIALDPCANASTEASASYTIAPHIDLTSATSSLTFNDFSSIGAYLDSFDGDLTATDGNTYGGWEKTQCMASGSILQMKNGSGIFTSPYIKTLAGYTVKVTYGASRGLTLTIGDDSATGGTGGGSSSYPCTVELTTTNAALPFTLTAGASATYVQSIEIKPLNVVQIGSAGYTTFTPAFNAGFPVEVTGYIATATSASTVTLTEVLAVPSGTPVVLKGSAGSYALSVENVGDCDDVSANLLEASDGSTEGDGSTIFALGVGKEDPYDGVVGFYLVQSGVTVPSGKAYLTVPAPAGVKEFLTFDFGEEDPDGISPLLTSPEEEEQRAAIYNLAGQRLNKMQKGINIVNGKKVLY